MKVPLSTFASRENELIAAIIIDLGQGRSRVTPHRAAEQCVEACTHGRTIHIGVKIGSALVEHKISASLPKPDIYAHNPVQDALVLTKSTSCKATSVCPHLPLINGGSGFCRSSHSAAHYHFGYRSRLGFRDRGNLLRYHPLRFTLR